MKLDRRVQNLVKQGIVSKETAGKIMIAEQIRKMGSAWKLMYFLAGMLIGLGCILLVSSNWDKIHDIIKLIGDFTIWGGLTYALYWSIVNKKENLKECLLTVSFLYVGATIGLIAQVFNLNGGWNSFAIAWALLSAGFVVFSRLRILNIVWLLILFSGINLGFWEYIFEHFYEYPVILTTVGVCLCGLLSYAGQKLYKAINGVIVLPRAFANLATIAMYWLGVFVLFNLGNIASRRSYYYYMHHHGEEQFFNWRAIGANTVAFIFFGTRLLLAAYHSNVDAFRRNTYIVCAYVLGMFLCRFENSFVKGIIFIAGGFFLLWLLYALQKFIKAPLNKSKVDE